jgi:hypothetical protein
MRGATHAASLTHPVIPGLDPGTPAHTGIWTGPRVKPGDDEQGAGKVEAATGTIESAVEDDRAAVGDDAASPRDDEAGTRDDAAGVHRL